MTAYTFPPDFLWGTATSAHQVEGGNTNNDCWVLEHLPDTIFVEPSGDAIDHYHRYPADITLLAQLGFNSYRFSIEWARIEPEEGFFSHAAIDHYRRVLLTCHEQGLKPMVTLHHFTSPRWLIRQGGWLNPATAVAFARYSRFVVEQLGDLIDLICTLNEINLFRTLALGPLRAEQPEMTPFLAQAQQAFGLDDGALGVALFAGTEEAREIFLLAHRQAVAGIKAERPDIPVGLTLALQALQAIEGGQQQRDKMRAETQDIYLEAVQEDDFLGVQTYSRTRFGPAGVLPPEEGRAVTQMGYEFYPQALTAVLRYAAQKSGLPLIVTENGIATADDNQRLAYFQQAITGVAECLQAGLKIDGYYAWSAFDNFEWIFGYRPTFGLIHVDRQTQVRTVKPSARWLGKIARHNGLIE